jgi:transposase
MAKERRRFEAAQKVKIIKEHLVEARPLSEVCEEYGIAPTQFYQWQKTLFENGTAAFEPKKAGRGYELENKLKQLNKKLAKKDEVIAESIASPVDLLKSLGEDCTIRGNRPTCGMRWLIMYGTGRIEQRFRQRTSGSGLAYLAANSMDGSFDTESSTCTMRGFLENSGSQKMKEQRLSTFTPTILWKVIGDYAI